MDTTSNATGQNEHPTDRDIIIAVFRMVGALAERLTGERLVVDLPHGDGTYTVSTHISPMFVRWQDLPCASAPLPESHHTPS